jgi:hypothetical protein
MILNDEIYYVKNLKILIFFYLKNSTKIITLQKT